MAGHLLFKSILLFALCTIRGPIRHFITWIPSYGIFHLHKFSTVQCNNEFHNGYKMNGKHFPIQIYSLLCQPKFNYFFLYFLFPSTVSSQWRFYFTIRAPHNTSNKKLHKNRQFPFRMRSEKSWNSIRLPIQLSITKLWRWLTTILLSRLPMDLKRNLFLHSFCHQLIVLIWMLYWISASVVSKTWPEFELFIYIRMSFNERKTLPRMKIKTFFWLFRWIRANCLLTCFVALRHNRNKKHSVMMLVNHLR